MKHPEHLPLQKYTGSLITVFQKATKKKDPAGFLDKSKTRSVLFMAESLTRLLKGIRPSEATSRALRTFKKMEDMLGKIEDYDNFRREFSKNPAIKKSELAYLAKKQFQLTEKLNDRLVKKDFYLPVFNTLFNHKIDFNEGSLIAELQKQIEREIEKACDFYAAYPVKFTDMESQVHELRRRLRWVSIYSQSLEGLIVLKTQALKFSWEKDFLSKKSLASAYNQVPVKKGLVKYIAFDQKAFYALNDTIARLGEIKDKGMAIETLAKAIKKTGSPEHKDPVHDAREQLGIDYTEEDLLEEAHVLLELFFIRHKIHEKLLAAIF